MKKVLITGATGFVGSHALEALMSRDDVEPIAACRDATRLLAGFHGEVREGDLRDASYRDQLVEGVDAIIHAMAWTSLWGHKADSERLYLQPSLDLIDAAMAAGVRRFINISTTSAAAPQASSDPMSHGIPRRFWPHLNNVIAIEESLRARAGERFTAVNLRLGVFAGRRYALGVLPILLPRLKTHLVPWVTGGLTHLPLIDGRDVGQALALAVTAEGLQGYEGFNIVGPEVPTLREVLTLLHEEYGYPLPHFSVPFSLAYPFAFLMESMDKFVPWEPLVTRSIILLLEEVAADNRRAAERLGYRPQYPWQQAVRAQLAEMAQRQDGAMRMYRPLT